MDEDDVINFLQAVDFEPVLRRFWEERAHSNKATVFPKLMNNIRRWQRQRVVRPDFSVVIPVPMAEFKEVFSLPWLQVGPCRAGACWCCGSAASRQRC
jgi:hypothetical protein